VFEDNKGLITIRKSKDRQQNDKRKRTHNDPKNITQKVKDRATRTQFKTGVKSGVPE